MLENNDYFNNLIAWYGTLLTDNQLDIMQSYYQEDLSLAEIAKNNNVSRSAIFDTIKRSENILINYEEKLQLYEKFTLRNKQYNKLKELQIEAVKEIVEQLEKIE